MKVLLLTGPGGDAQGWGDMAVTRSVADTIGLSGYLAESAYVESEADFFSLLDRRDFDIVWSALYHITPNDKFIGRNVDGCWVADVLDSRHIPYVGSNSQTMRDMIDKYHTHVALARRGVPVPTHYLLRSADDMSAVRYPAFVKPMCESRSVGISDDSVVDNEEQLRRQVAYIEHEFDEAALVEDFMPGDEFTVLVVGNGGHRECLPGLVTVDAQHYGRHKVLRADLRGVGLTHIHPPGPRATEAMDLATHAADAMNCLDHVRIDIKTDAAGALRIMEVNGIPGLKPYKSWGPQLYTLHHHSPGGEMEDYQRLVKAVVDSALRRYSMSSA